MVQPGKVSQTKIKGLISAGHQPAIEYLFLYIRSHKTGQSASKDAMLCNTQCNNKQVLNLPSTEAHSYVQTD